MSSVRSVDWCCKNGVSILICTGLYWYLQHGSYHFQWRCYCAITQLSTTDTEDEDACVHIKFIHDQQQASDYSRPNYRLEAGRTHSVHASCPPGYLYFITENDKTVLLTILYHSPCFCNVVMGIRTGWWNTGENQEQAFLFFFLFFFLSARACIYQAV